MYSNFAGQMMLSDVLADGLHYRTFHEHDGKGRVTLVAHPSAVAGNGVSSAHLDLLGGSGDQHYAGLKTDEGLIELFEYDHSSVPEGYLYQESIKRGDGGTPIPQRTYGYYTYGTVTVVDSVTTYADEAGQTPITISHLYAGWSGNQPTFIITTLPYTPDSQIEGGNTLYTEYDSYGRITGSLDADGNYQSWSYDDATDAMTSWTIGGQTTTVTDFDSLGRPKTVVDPRNKTTTYDYLDSLGLRQVTITPPAGPVERTRHNLLAGTIETWRTTPDGQLTLVEVRPRNSRRRCCWPDCGSWKASRRWNWPGNWASSSLSFPNSSSRTTCRSARCSEL